MCLNIAMVIARSKITSQSQISVPYLVRKKLGIGPGSVLEWADDGDNVVVKRAVRYSSQDIHNAIFSKTVKAKSLEQLKEGVGKAIDSKEQQAKGLEKQVEGKGQKTLGDAKEIVKGE